MQEQVLQPTRRTRARAAVDEPTTTEEPLRPAVKPIQEQRLPRSVMRDRADHRARSPLETRKQVRVATAPPREVFAQPGSAIDRFDESEIVDSGFAETPTDTILDILGQLNRVSRGAQQCSGDMMTASDFDALVVLNATSHPFSVLPRSM